MGHDWEPGTPKPTPDVMALIQEYAEMEDPDEIPDWARQLLGASQHEKRQWQPKRRKEVHGSDDEPKERGGVMQNPPSTIPLP